MTEIYLTLEENDSSILIENPDQIRAYTIFLLKRK